MNNEFQEYIQSVEKYYDAHPYPFRDPQKETGHIYTTATDHLGKINHYCFKGRRDLREGCRFLVAGGGTGDAAIYLAEQLRASDSEVVYIDISAASMQVAQQRAHVRGLNNISWRHGSLLDLPAIEVGQFDYISCSGVLHHLGSPVEGLNALASVLNDSGCMGLLVYARYGRSAIYRIQEILQIVNAGIDDLNTRIENARSLLNTLPDDHWLLKDKHRWLDEIRQMGLHNLDSDAALFHLFLNRDHSFTVVELQDLAIQSGMHFVGLTGFPGRKRQYNPAGMQDIGRFSAVIDNLPLASRQAVGEMLDGSLISHTFYTSREKDTIADPADAENVPYFEYSFAPSEQMYLAMHDNPGKSISIHMGERLGYLVINQERHTRFLLRYIDGERSLAEIYRCVREDPAVIDKESANDAGLSREFRLLYGDLFSWDMMLLRRKGIRRYERLDELLQAPDTSS